MDNEKYTLDELSDREREILHLVATGASNKEIASSLFISSNTVKVHLRNIFVKIGATSRTEAAMIAVNTGLVEAGAGLKSSRIDGGEQVSRGQTVSVSQDKSRIWIVSGIAILVLILAISFLVFRLSQSPDPAAASGSLPANQQRWKQHASLPLPRKDLAITAFGKQIYALGGESKEGVTGRTERYDPETDQWESLPEMPVPVTEIAAAVAGGKIYIPGGKTASGELSSLLQIYDPAGKKWASSQSLPVQVSAYALASFEGNLYLFGGWDGNQYSNRVFIYHPDGNRWEDAAPMPTARGFAGAAVAGGNIYVLGGFDGKHALPVNEVFNPGQAGSGGNPWSTAKPLPEGRYAMGTCTVADIVHVLGGVSETSQALQPSVYFPQEDQWLASKDALASSWSHMGVATLETSLYAVGGWWQDSVSGRNYSYQAIYTISLPLLVR